MAQTQEKVVGILLKGYPRLSETFIANEILLLEKLGFKLHIFALRNPGEAKVHERVRRVRAGVTYIPDYPFRFFFSLLYSNMCLWRRRPGLYWQAFCFAMRCSWRYKDSSPFKRFVQAGYFVQKALPGTGVRHVHAHFSNDPATVAFFASWLTGISYSISAHAKDIYVEKNDFLRRKIAQARFVVTCTEYNKNYLQKLVDATTPILRCYHGIDLEYFSVPAKTKSGSPPAILSVGRFVPKKGFSVLIQALHLLRQTGQEFRCDIIGGGPLAGALHDQIAKLQLSDCVHLHSQMSQHELLAYYRAASLFALACEVQSDGDRDGIPNVIVEAMAMGIPIVSTRISGIPECVEEGANGFLVAEKDPSALAQAMASLLKQPELARQFGRAAREKVEREFDAGRNVKQIGAALREILEDNSRLQSFSGGLDKPDAVNTPHFLYRQEIAPLAASSWRTRHFENG
jgi:glycosyltransferase involved in cell wall biosynthesis